MLISGVYKMNYAVVKNKNKRISFVKGIGLKNESLFGWAFFLLIVLVWTKDILLSYVIATFRRIPLLGGATDILVDFVFILAIVFSIPYIIKRLKFNDIIFGLVILISYLLNYLLFPKNEEVLNDNIAIFLLKVVPFYFIGISLRTEKYFNLLYILSMLNISSLIFYKLFLGTPMDSIASQYEGDMNLAYEMLPHLCIIIYVLFNKPNIFNLVLSLGGGILLFSLGSRGPLACCVLFIVCYLLLFKKYKHPIIVYSIIFLMGLIFCLSFDWIMLQLNNISMRLGLSIRIFSKYIEGDFFGSSGREVISETLLVAIKEKFVFGYGIGADRVLSGSGSYAHNIALEFFTSFGVIWGSIFMIFLLIVLFFGFKRSSSNEKRGLILVLIFSSFLKLFLSGSYLHEANLFLLLGLCIQSIRLERYGMSSYKVIG